MHDQSSMFMPVARSSKATAVVAASAAAHMHVLGARVHARTVLTNSVDAHVLLAVFHVHERTDLGSDSSTVIGIGSRLNTHGDQNISETLR